MVPVFDASTLILLAKVDLLRDVCARRVLRIPGTVKDECLTKKSPDALLIAALIEEQRIRVEPVRGAKMIRQLCRDFHIEQGEAEALYLAKQDGALLAVDDGPTIKACKVLGQPFVTAIHFVIEAAARKDLSPSSALVTLEKLATYGRYSPRILQDAAARIREGG